MKNNVIISLLKKEFLNIIRDRKSFLIMILLPLLYFPLMIGIMGLMMTSFTKIDEEIKLGVNYKITNEFREFVNNYNDDFNISIINEDEKTLESMFNNNEIGVYVIKNNNEYLIYYDQNNNNYIASNIIIEKLYQDYRELYIKKELANLNIDYQAIKDNYKITSVQKSITDMGSFVPSIISMVLMMVISTVCISVAVDITTSEKEKGTLETLLSLPIKKKELITAKYLTTFILSCLSGLLASISLFVTLYFAKDLLLLLGVTGININLSVLLIYLIAIILISSLLSALVLSVAIFSKNLKEAQSSLYPITIITAFSSILPMFGITATIKYSIIPFVNITLLFSNALSTNISVLFVILAFVSTIIFNIILIIIISKIYSQEEILFDTKSLNNIIFEKGKKKTINFNVFVSLLIIIISYLLSIYFSFIFINSSKYILILLPSLTILLVVLVSMLIVKLDYKVSFKLNKFSLKKLLYTIFLFLGTSVISSTIIEVVSTIFPKIVTDFTPYADFLKLDNMIISILIIGIIAPIAEELLFRGVLFNSVNKKYGVIAGILVSALLFGVYHMNWIQGINAFILGLVLAYSYFKTNSLFVPIIIHALNNMLSVILDYYNILNFQMSNISIIVTIISAIFIIILNIYLLEKKNKKI